MDRIDDAYNGLMGEDFMRKTRERLHWICTKVAGENVLDVGCSQGTLARLLAPLGKHVLGIDINKDAIAYAEGKLPELDVASRERLQFLATNFMDFKSEAQFDTVVMGEILEHLPDPAAFVKKACAHLVKGGTFVATVPFGINDDPDHRQTFYWSWVRDMVAPFFDIVDVNIFGKWIGVVGVKRERKTAAEKTVPFALVKELEKAFYAIERPLVNDNKARVLKLKTQTQDLDEAKKKLSAKAAEARAAMDDEAAQKARADKLAADYAKLKTDLSSEIARQKDALAKLAADKTAADAAAAKQKTVLEGEVARQKTALAAEQAKVKDLNSKLAATRNELAATKNEALELRVNLDAEKKMSDGQQDQISVLKATLQFAANRSQNDPNETKLLEYSQEVRELRSALESKREEAVERAERLGHLSGQLEALKAEKELLSLRINELSDALDKKTGEADSAAECIKMHERGNAKLESEKKNLLDELQRTSGEITALEQKNSQCAEALAQEKTKVAELTATLAQAHKDAEDKAAALSNSIGELEAYAKLCETEITKLTNDKEALARAKDVQFRDIGVLKGEKGAVEVSLAAANAEKGALTSRVSELESSLAAAKDSAQENVARILELSSDLSKSKARADKAVADYYKLKNDLLSRIAEQDDALAKMAAAKEAIEEKNAKTEELSADLAKANARVDKAAEDYCKLESDLKARIAERDDALAKLAAAKEAIEEKNAKAEELSADLAKANARIDKAAEDYCKLESDLKARIAEQDDALAKLTAEKAAVEAETAKRDTEFSNQIDFLRKERRGLLSALRHSEKIAQRESAKYDKLSKAKLGRLTLAYWSFKDGFKKKSNHKQKVAGKAVVQNGRLDVSVVIPTYKENPYIDAAVRSILEQDYRNGEIKILLCVNGGDARYFESLRRAYRDYPSVKVLFTERNGPNAGRNVGLSEVTTELVTFLDDDDTFTPGYVRVLAEAFMRPSVSIVAGRLEDYYEATAKIVHETYINSVIEKAGAGEKTDYYSISSIFGSFCAKMYRSSLFKSSFLPLEEGIKHSEDVVFWAKNYGRLTGSVYLVDPDSKEAYVRRVRQGSTSRPSRESEYAFYVTDRLAIIRCMSELLTDEDVSMWHKKFLVSKLKTQTSIMRNYVQKLSGGELAKASAEINSSDDIFLNKAIFSNRVAIAFCHNFSPAVDASAFVATKRLVDIDGLEGSPLQWHVIKQNMTTIRKSDMLFQIYYSDFRAAEQTMLSGSFGFAPAAQQRYCQDAVDRAMSIKAEVIYSRALFVGSHMAAAEYKKAHPFVKWYAEFSDPLSRGVDGNPRPCKGTPTWEDVEQLVYRGADVIIFTNRSQMEYMLSYNPCPELNDSIRRRAKIMPHPVISHKYCNISRYSYDLDEEAINIGFFGTFYSTRKIDDLQALLHNPKVVLHIFTTKPEELENSLGDRKSQVRINQTVSHFEFLNLAKRLDYLILNDTSFPGAVNPFMPSKYADYVATGTPIIAIVQSGSELSKVENPLVTKTGEITLEFVQGLHKRRNKD